MNNKASIANLLNDNNNDTSSTSSSSSSPSYEILQDATSTINNDNNNLNTSPFSQFQTTNASNASNTQQLQPPSSFMTYPNLPQQPDSTTIVNGVQNANPHAHPPQQFTHNWLSPNHPLYTYDPHPEMSPYKRPKKKPINPPKKKKQIRRRNHAKKPHDRLKRPRNGYMIYMNEVYEDVKRKNPHLRFGELSTLIGVQWKEMSQVEQMPYHQKHEEEKATYESAKLAMSRSNLQIVEETNDIEQQVRAAEIKAAKLKRKKLLKQQQLKQQQKQQRNRNNRINRSDSSNSEIPSTQQQHDEEENGDDQPICIKEDDDNHVGLDALTLGNETVDDGPPKPSQLTVNDAKIVPITPTSQTLTNPTSNIIPQENSSNSTRQKTTFVPPSREARDKYFKKHFPDLDEASLKRKSGRDTITEFNTITAPQSAEEQSMDEDLELSIPMYSKGLLDQSTKVVVSSSRLSNKAAEDHDDEEDDDDEEVDELSRSDSEMEVIESVSSTSKISETNKSNKPSKSPEESNITDDEDTSDIWYLPIEGTSVSSGLTPHRKRKVVILEDSEDSITEQKKVLNKLNKRNKKDKKV